MEIEQIPVEIVRKRIKHIYVRVCPPHGEVRVSAPVYASERRVRAVVKAKLPWIRRSRAAIANRPPVVVPALITGESIDLWGESYRLIVTEKNAPPQVSIAGGDVVLNVRPGASAAKREYILNEWYRSQLKACVPALISKWEPVMGVRVNSWSIKRMKTRWGSCNLVTHRIWINLELAKLPKACLEYLVVHEMTHLLERYHNAHFKQLMDQFLPQWRAQRDELHRVPLAAERALP